MVDICKKNIIYEYEKNIKNYFLFIKNIKINKDSYEFKILEEEIIENILKPKIQIENNEYYYSFDISKLFSLEQYIKYNKLKKKDIIFIIKSIDGILNNIENYLISENSILLDLKSIFLNKYDKKVNLNFIIIPNLNIDFSFELSKLLIKLMRYIDLEDKDALQLAYELFVKSSKDNYTINDLIESIPEDYEENEDVDFDDIYNYEIINSENENINEDEVFEIIEKDYDDEFNNEIKNLNQDKDVEEGITIDDKAKNFLTDELFEDFEDKNSNFNAQKKIIKSRKRIQKNFLNVNEIFDAVFVPLVSVSVPFGIFLIYGRDVLFNNILKIFIFEAILIFIFVLDSFIKHQTD